ICLKQNYPNPFNPSTTITYSLPEAGEVELLIYDLQGRMVDKLFSGPQSAGTHDILWNGVNQNGFPISSGVYLCKLLAGEYIKTIKMVYLR
ncbi:MAG: T9SS type A sorting domain-containing protein, partial [Candidatus Marinimicrobia bacterium]|nr:T9SS type A sorting domain-containing protein [Candidatus Neomarinimicrobiota bacterium]